MVIVEEINSEVFDQLPTRNGFKPVYDWGNEYNLIKTLQLFEKDGKSPYPLIYQTSKGSEQNSSANIATIDLVFILACRNLETDLTNRNRWALTYKNILYPLVADIEKCFKKAGVYVWDGNYTVDEFPNYGNGKENKTVDIWDALLFKTSIQIEGKKCVNNNIKF